MQAPHRAHESSRGGNEVATRILFVDDDTALLDGLRIKLTSRKEKWRMTFVESGSRALVEMEREPLDVIVSDLRMPNMDGAELLQKVSERWPDAVRIILSAPADLRHTMRVVPIAHQYVTKPCDARQLENRIERCLSLRELLRKPELRKAVGRIRKLPTIPRTYSMLQSLLESEQATTAEVAKIVAADSVITAKVLQLVNSSFFGLARRITNIPHAVSFLGFTAISNVVLSAEVFEQWTHSEAGARLDVERLQLHARTVAAAANALSAKTPLMDDATLAGLLHDIGYWVLAQECPYELDEAIQLAAAHGIPLHEAEAKVIGASHAEVGAYLLGLWGLPYNVVEAVAHHHSPERVQQTELDALAAVAVAHSLTGLGDSGAFDVPLPPDPKVDAAYLKSLNAPFDWEEAERRVNESLSSSGAMF
jgi:putative nucleotidyltransferase with HDIG domain